MDRDDRRSARLIALKAVATIARTAASRLAHRPPPPRTPPTACVHRGDVVDRVKCQTCSGSVMAKVQACALHGRCTLFSKPIDGVRACRGCMDRKPLPDDGRA